MRYSGNETENQVIKNGFDYDVQVWVKDFIVQDCKHPGGNTPELPCCNARRYRGRDIESVKAERRARNENN